jgi:hypothetical protein
MSDPKFESVTVESGRINPVLECHVEPRLKISARSSRESLSLKCVVLPKLASRLVKYGVRSGLLLVLP